MKKCKCGCGRNTKIILHTHVKDGRIRGNYNDYIHGHNGNGLSGKTMEMVYGKKKASRIKNQIKKTLQYKIKEGVVKKSYLTIGNGRGMNKLETYFYNKFLNSSWKYNYAIGIKPQIKRYPRNYKVDFYNEKLNICVEIDGKIHNTEKQKILDRKKTDMLRSRGFYVIRLSESDILKMTKKEFLKWLY